MAEMDAKHAEKILQVTHDLAVTQALNPNLRDGAGFSNADYPAAFTLAMLGDVAGCAALLRLYPRQAKAEGVTLDMIQPYLGDSLDMANTEARIALKEARSGAAGTLAWVERKDGILFQGLNLDYDLKADLKAYGEKTAQGWLVKKDKLALVTKKAETVAKLDELKAIIESVPQSTEAPARTGKAAPAPLQIEINPHYQYVNWTQPFGPEGVAVRDMVKRLGARWNPDCKRWDLADPLAIQALIILAKDLDAPVVGIEPDPAMAEAAEAMAEEIRAGVVKVIIVAQTEQEVYYRLRSKVDGAWDKAKSVGAIYDRNRYGGAICVDKSALRDLVTKLDPLPIDLSPFMPIIERYDIAQVQAIDPEILAAIPSQTPTGFNFFDHQRDGMAFLMTLGLADERIKALVLT